MTKNKQNTHTSTHSAVKTGLMRSSISMITSFLAITEWRLQAAHSQFWNILGCIHEFGTTVTIPTQQL